MTRPLYLDAALAWEVRLDDGPALRISAPGRAHTWFPLVKLARVVTPVSAQWDCAALLACLRAGVPVLFHDHHGEIVGWCFGPRKRETTLAHLLRLAVDHPEGPRWIGQWQVCAERREMLAAMRELNLYYGQDVCPRGVRARLCNAHRDRLGQASGPWVRALCQAVHGLAAQRVGEYVGDPALIGHALPGLHLAQRVGELMQWRVHRVINASPLASFCATTPAKWAASTLERHGAALHQTAGELLGMLECQLRRQLG